MKNIFISSDHAGYNLKEQIKKKFSKKYKFKDLGPNSSKISVNYPEYAHKLCKKVGSSSKNMGILVCGSGMGMCMAANRHSHIRCALCRSTDDAIISREHNNANVCALGSRFTGETVSHNIVRAFLNTEFLGGRYKDRMDQIS